MSVWKAKRFWKSARAVEVDGGFGVELDGRPVRTPAKAAMVLPTRALAEAMAAEWNAQEGEIRPGLMPITRAANAAIDKVSKSREEVAQMLAAYAENDLLCHRAEAPQELVRRQAEAWDPLLDWAAEAFGARLLPVKGVMPAPQDRQALRRLAAPVHALDPFALTAMHDLVALSGSLVIGLAAALDAREIGALWRASRIDESWQEDQWGVDEEARRMAAAKEYDFRAAKRFHELAGRCD